MKQHMDTGTPEGGPCWADLGGADPGAVPDFYRGLFGWELGPAAAGDDSYRLFLSEGRPVAGLATGPEQAGPAGWRIWLAAADADKTAGQIGGHPDAGAAAPAELPGVGRGALATDPAGAAFGVLSRSASQGEADAGPAGALYWATLTTNGPEAADRFYSEVFGFDIEPAPADSPLDLAAWLLDGEPACHRLGMGPGYPAGVAPHWMAYFAVPDADDAARRAAELGGTVAGGPFDSPLGRVAILVDPAGGAFSVVAPAGGAR